MFDFARASRLLLALALAGAACHSESTEKATGAVTLRIGYFPNLTHAPAIIGFDQGLFAKELGPSVTIEAKTFNAGPEAVEAIFSDALDLTYIGPNPAINAYAKSRGEAIRIIAGATSGGAALVVRPEIARAADLAGKKIASPQLGNTQDVALRSWLRSQGLTTTKEGGGDVSIVAQANAQTLDTFKTGAIQGAWVPEPWATRLVLEGGGKVLVNEATLWPDGKFVTTHVIVRTDFLKAHPDLVSRFLRAHVAAVDFATSRGADARGVVNSALEKLTGKGLKPEVIEAAWRSLTFTVDPIASSLRKSAEDARSVGLLDPVDLSGIYALEPLNAVLGSLGKAPVSG
jgi:NitT/TauT family transport system substrate-binding protein